MVLLWRSSLRSHYLLEVALSLLVAGDLLDGVGIFDAFAEDGRDPARDPDLLVSGTASETSEHTDWISEMSKSEASLPRRLLALLPVLLPARLVGRLGTFLDSKAGTRDLPLEGGVVVTLLSSPEWKLFPERYPGGRNLLPWMGVTSGDGTRPSGDSGDL